VVAEAAAPDANGPFGLPVLEQLTKLIRVDHALAYIEYDPSRARHLADPHAWTPASVEYPVVEYPSYGAGAAAGLTIFNPLGEETVGDSEIPLTLSDFLTPRARLRNPFVQAYLRPVGVEHELKVFFPAAPGTICQFDFTRGPGSDFDERDRAILALLRPHLAQLRHRWAQSLHSDYLTTREHEIIRHVARGLTNREIAEQLVVSTNTVRSHLDRIYEKLGVHTRTAAVAAATSNQRTPGSTNAASLTPTSNGTPPTLP
jgi:DNA-binding CsgD family transcriptional regulator